MRLIDVPMGENDINAKTVGEFLKALLITLLKEGEGFSGKRPFGNSDWQEQVYTSLIKAGYEIGKLDEDGYVETLDWPKADKLVTTAISELFDNPVRHGRWEKIHYADEPVKTAYRCSVCHTTWDEPTNGCPYCRAKMNDPDNT